MSNQSTRRPLNTFLVPDTSAVTTQPHADPPPDTHAATDQPPSSDSPSTTASAAPPGLPSQHRMDVDRPPRFPHRTLRLAEWGALVVLVLLFVGQILVANRAHWAENPAWRPTMMKVCHWLHCTLPIWHEPAAFTMLQRDISPTPDHPGVLRIHVIFRNDAHWDQAWPRLELILADADGRLTGAQVFEPREYLGRPVAAEETLVPGQSAQILFQVREPAAGTSAFTFEFY